MATLDQQLQAQESTMLNEDFLVLIESHVPFFDLTPKRSTSTSNPLLANISKAIFTAYLIHSLWIKIPLSCVANEWFVGFF